MFFFRYDPLYKNVLPYWDKFPLVIPFDINATSFIGLNIHYLPIPARQKLLDILGVLRTKKTTREYMRISYKFIKSASQTELFQPCIHRYLKSHLRSRLVKVDPDEWRNAADLPVQQFQYRG